MTTFEVDEVSETNQDLIPCTICRRKFLSERLRKHMEICRKQKAKPRKVFDSSKQRSVGDQETLKEPSSAKPPKSSKSKISKPVSKKGQEKPKSNWRAQHEEFIRTVRAARGMKVDVTPEDDGKRIPVGYVECSTCGRSFTKAAAERHIPWCKEQKARIPRSPSSNEAMARYKARTKYKPASNQKKMEKSHSIEGLDTINNRNATTSTSKKVQVVQRGKSPARDKVQVVQRGKSPARDKVQATKVASRVKTRLQQDNLNNKKHPKTPVMKFKEKFPNHIKINTMTSKYIEEKQDLQELLKRPNTYKGPSAPKTVPGVRTRGQSPHRDLAQDEQELHDLKVKIEEMYLNGRKVGSTFRKTGSSSELILPSSQGKYDSGTRGSTSGSSDGVRTPISNSRTNSSEAGSHFSGNSNLPRSCHQCGTKYPSNIAKFCCECGARRLGAAGHY